MSIGDLLPSATDLKKKIALEEAAKADAEMRKRAEAEAEKQALLDQLTKPSGVSDEEGVRRGAAIIQRAANNGLTEVQVYRFPNQLTTDRGRAINQMEPGWESTLTGVSPGGQRSASMAMSRVRSMFQASTASIFS